MQDVDAIEYSDKQRKFSGLMILRERRLVMKNGWGCQKWTRSRVLGEQKHIWADGRIWARSPAVIVSLQTLNQWTRVGRTYTGHELEDGGVSKLE